MKQEDLFRAIGDLDDAVLDENVTEIKKASGFRYILPIAACLVLAGGAIALPLATDGGLNVGESVAMEPSDVHVNMTESVPISTEAVTEDGTEAATQPPAEVILPALHPSEKYLNQVYFGSEFPAFIYGNEDYCIFTEGMGTLFVFDFKQGEITFATSIVDSFDLGGVPHGSPEFAWNGIGMLAYLENGEPKILCTADTGGDGSTTKGFKLDMENGMLTEIPDFRHENFDFIHYVYNTPVDGFDFLFGAAPIPLEDGYICFGNSGLNNEILPGEGSHLPMIEIRKVKGEQVKKWVPFAFMVE